MDFFSSTYIFLPTLPNMPWSEYTFAQGFCTVAVTGAAQPQPLSAGRKLGVAIAQQETSWTELQSAPQISPGPSHIGRTSSIICGAQCKMKMVKNFKAVTAKHEIKPQVLFSMEPCAPAQVWPMGPSLHVSFLPPLTLVLSLQESPLVVRPLACPWKLTLIQNQVNIQTLVADTWSS